MQVRFLEAGDVRARFEAACARLGEGEARRAFSMALNKEGRKSFTQLRRSLAQQSSIPRGAVNATTRFTSATRNIPGHGYETARCAGYAANLNSVAASDASAFCSALT